jgi:hypothetical protein
MTRLMIALALALSLLPLPSLAKDSQRIPDRLTFGYEEEGKIDPTESGCEVFVKDMVEWSEDEMKRAIKEVCAARRKHVEAYADMQKSYALLVAQIRADTRLEQASAVKNIEAMVKACIDHKTALTPGGHNIAIDIIPNEIAAECLTIGKRLLDDETAWLATAPEKHTRASP